MIEGSIFLHICCAILMYGASISYTMNEEGESFEIAKIGATVPAVMGLFFGGFAIFIGLFIYDFYVHGVKFWEKD